MVQLAIVGFNPPAAFNQYGADAVGFTIHSLLGSGKVYGTTAMPLIKDFFANR